MSDGMHSHKTRLFVKTWDGTSTAEDNDPSAVLALGGGGGWSQLMEVFAINGVPAAAGVTRLTHLDSPSKAHEKVPAISDGGQVTFSLNYEGQRYGDLLALKPDPDVNDFAPTWGRHVWLTQFPDGGQMIVIGFIAGTPFTVPEDDKVSVEGTIEVHGKPHFVVPS